LSILSNIHSREDILALSVSQQEELCREIREYLIKHVSDSGGHLASNLGIVEATVAIHKVFDTSVDRLVFDVGHQSYVHKMLTGRMEQFDSLRKFGGLSGFPKPDESVHDAFIAGHASNAVSVALGLARARTLEGSSHQVIALLGDGALTGGLSYEGLNDTGDSGEHVIVLLNDNGMSITKNVGGISRHLALLRLKPGYFGLKKAYRKFTSVVPGGKWLYKLTHHIKSFFKRSLIGTAYFEEMGMNYLGPVDGHDVERVAYFLNVAKEMEGPCLVHIITKKGRGYEPAERSPQDYHGVGQFDPSVGLSSSASSATYADVFGETLVNLAEKDHRICAVTAAMPHGTGLAPFAAKFPDRFFDVGIAEGHAVSMASGLACGGMIPVVALYSTFLQRSYDMLLHDVALMQNHVIFAVDRAGLVGEDGPTHHGAFDVGYLRQIPGMTVFSPATEEELRSDLSEAIKMTGPVAIRYPRGKCLRGDMEKWKAPVSGAKITVVSYGSMMAEVSSAVSLLHEMGITAQTIQLKTLKPICWNELAAAAGTEVFVVEETVSNGCVGRELAEVLAMPVHLINLGDDFVPHGSVSELRALKKIDAQSICNTITEVMRREK